MSEPSPDESTLVDDYDFAGTGDDSYSIALFKTADGRHFIYIRTSDFGSKYAGALGFDQWVAEDQVADWTDL